MEQMMELWIDRWRVGYVEDYSICTEFDYIKQNWYGVAIRKPTTADHYIDIKFIDKNVHKYLYYEHPLMGADGWRIVYYPPILLTTTEIMELKSPGKVITCTDVKIVQETTTRGNVRCHCESIEMCINQAVVT